MDTLKLIAFDAEDLAVLSAHLQDAVVKIGDMTYRPGEKRFAALFNRFDWSKASQAGANAFERVLAAKLTGIDLARTSDVLSLLAIRYEGRAAGDPSGTVTLVFAGQAAIRLEVECIEGELRDLGGAWRARAKPQHPVGDRD